MGIFGPPFAIDEHWREWLGTVKVENLTRTSLALFAHAKSDRPEILDNENETLVNITTNLFYGLLMTNVLHHDNIIVLSGANIGQGASVRQVSDLQPHFRPNGVGVRRITIEELQSAARIATGQQTIQSISGLHERLRSGLRA